MKKWVVINEIKNGDSFPVICESREEAEDKAEDIFSHLTRKEKEKNILCIAEMEMDEDGCPDWITGYTPVKTWLE